MSSSESLEGTNRREIQTFKRKRCGDRIRLATSDKIPVPIATGIFQPTIVLPRELVRYADAGRLRHSLEHEWKHIERKDLVTWQLVGFCQILLWPQPCYWILRRELRLSQDQIADQYAISDANEQTEYATTLVEFSKARQSTMFGALTMAGSKSNLYRRVEMLLNTEFTVAGVSRKRIVLGFASLMFAAGIVMTSLQLTRAAEDLKAADQEVAATEETQAADHFGFVVDAYSGKPVVDATVIVTRMRSGTWEEIAITESQTDETGKFNFTIPTEHPSRARSCASNPTHRRRRIGLLAKAIATSHPTTRVDSRPS